MRYRQAVSSVPPKPRSLEEVLAVIAAREQRLRDQGIPPYVGCGALHGGPGHRCPADDGCMDCGRAADVFIADPNIYSVSDFGPEADLSILATGGCPICDDCLARRLTGAGRRGRAPTSFLCITRPGTLNSSPSRIQRAYAPRAAHWMIGRSETLGRPSTCTPRRAAAIADYRRGVGRT